jgi:hypothetical protein
VVRKPTWWITRVTNDREMHARGRRGAPQIVVGRGLLNDEEFWKDSSQDQLSLGLLARHELAHLRQHDNAATPLATGFLIAAAVLALVPDLIVLAISLCANPNLADGILAVDAAVAIAISVVGHFALLRVRGRQADMHASQRPGKTDGADLAKALTQTESAAALTDTKVREVVAAYGEGTAVKALARQHKVAPRTIRRILVSAGPRTAPDQIIDALSGDGRDEQSAAVVDADVVLDVPGLIADHLNAAGDEEVRQAAGRPSAEARATRSGCRPR